MFMNVILIPFFIDVMVALEDHPTKSSRQITILNRNFFFMLLNSLLLPLTGLASIKAFWKALENEEVVNWPSYFAANLMTTYAYFFTYFIQLTFSLENFAQRTILMGFFTCEAWSSPVKFVAASQANFGVCQWSVFLCPTKRQLRKRPIQLKNPRIAQRLPKIVPTIISPSK